MATGREGWGGEDHLRAREEEKLGHDCLRGREDHWRDH